MQPMRGREPRVNGGKGYANALVIPVIYSSKSLDRYGLIMLASCGNWRTVRACTLPGQDTPKITGGLCGTLFACK